MGKRSLGRRLREGVDGWGHTDRSDPGRRSRRQRGCLLHLRHHRRPRHLHMAPPCHLRTGCDPDVGDPGRNRAGKRRQSVHPATTGQGCRRRHRCRNRGSIRWTRTVCERVCRHHIPSVQRAVDRAAHAVTARWPVRQRSTRSRRSGHGHRGVGAPLPGVSREILDPGVYRHRRRADTHSRAADARERYPRRRCLLGCQCSRGGSARCPSRVPCQRHYATEHFGAVGTVGGAVHLVHRSNEFLPGRRRSTERHGLRSAPPPGTDQFGQRRNMRSPPRQLRVLVHPGTGITAGHHVI